MARLKSALRQEELASAFYKTTTLVRWKSVPLVPCADNVIAEARACFAAVQLAIEYHRHCLEQGMSQDGMVIQGDILPLLNYLQGKGRVKRLEVVRILEDCQSLLACAPFIFRLVYLPRECNKLADYFAGQASARAKLYADQPLEVATYRALPPYHLAQKLGFVIENGTLQSVPAFVLTECPAAASEVKHNFGIAQDYLATARSNEGRQTIGYKPSSSDGYGRFYAVGSAAQQLPRRARLLLFGNSHCEVDISGAHYELARRYCAQAGAHVSLLPIHRIRDWLRVVLIPPENQASPDDFEGLIKRWPLVVINSDSPQEALAFLSRQLPYLPGTYHPISRVLHMSFMRPVGTSCIIHRHGALPECVTGAELHHSVSMKPWNSTSPGLHTIVCNLLLASIRPSACMMVSGLLLVLLRSTSRNCTASSAIAIISHHKTLPLSL